MTVDRNRQGSDARLRQLLAEPPVPADLSERIRANLAAPRLAPRGRRRARAVSAAFVAVMLAGLLLLARVDGPTPDLIDAAYDDMLRERGLHGRFDDDARHWFAAMAVQIPEGAYLDLSKDCMLDGVSTRHLRLVHPELGRVNLFVYTSPSTQIAAASGALGDQRWLLLEPRPGLAAVVLYENGRKHESITRLLARMFAAPVPVYAPLFARDGRRHVGLPPGQQIPLLVPPSLG